jgi:hypothetical protein
VRNIPEQTGERKWIDAKSGAHGKVILFVKVGGLWL